MENVQKIEQKTTESIDVYAYLVINQYALAIYLLYYGLRIDLIVYVTRDINDCEGRIFMEMIENTIQDI